MIGKPKMKRVKKPEQVQNSLMEKVKELVGDREQYGQQVYDVAMDIKATLDENPEFIVAIEGDEDIMELLRKLEIIPRVAEAVQVDNKTKLESESTDGSQVQNLGAALQLEEDEELGPLSKVPKEVLDCIFKSTDFKTLQILRKVSKPIRKFIDDTSTEINLTFLALGASGSTRNMYMNHPNFKRGVTYKKFRNPEDNTLGCTFQIYKNPGDLIMEKEIVMEDVDFSEMARNDLKEILSHQKTVIPRVEFNIQNEVFMWGSDLYKKYMKTFKEDILTVMKGKMRVETLTLIVMEQKQILDLLEIIDPVNLQVLKFSAYCVTENSNVLDITNIVKTPHWKTATDLDSVNFWFHNPIKDFAHFKVAKFWMFEISVEDVIFLRSKYLQSPEFVSCEISYFTFRGFLNLIETLGSPNTRETDGEVMWDTWKFGLSMEPTDIDISLYSTNKIKFHRIPRRSRKEIVIIDRKELTRF